MDNVNEKNKQVNWKGSGFLSVEVGRRRQPMGKTRKIHMATDDASVGVHILNTDIDGSTHRETFMHMNVCLS